MLLDTNTVVYYLQSSVTPDAVRLGIRAILQEVGAIISVITEMELQCWKHLTEQDAGLIRAFINDATVIPLNEAVKTAAIAVRRQSGIKLPDAVIAASALVLGVPLVSRNERDFRRVAGLQLVNPWAL